MAEETLDIGLSNQSLESDSLNMEDISNPANTSTEVKKKETEVNRRLSSRTRVKPTYFTASPIVSSSSSKVSSANPTPTQTPRINANTNKRNDTQENERSKDESEDDDISSQDDGVFKKPQSVPRKRPAKNTLNVSVKKTKANKSRNSTSSSSSLFDIVKDGKSALMSVINDWIESYTNDKVAAMTELIQFFINCSGCNAEVTKNMLEAEDTVRAIRHLTENFGEQAEEYPLVITRPEFKKFKGNFISFILQLINLSQHSIIYDDEMMDILICWVTGLSDSQVRAFRHTSTLAAMKIVSGLIEVARKVGVEMDHTQRQLDGENLKTANKKSREKVEKLKTKRDELRQNKTELEDMMNRIFSSIFIHRYRDVRPEIRALCIAEMGQWLHNYSIYFFNGNYLKYFGWTLYDKTGEVRLEVLSALEGLYKNEDFLEKLELFTGRFKDRLINMTLDVDADVAVKAIKLSCLLYKYDALEEDDCSQVEQLVFCDHRRMAHAAGEFLALRIIRLSIEASPKKLKKGHKDDYLRQMNIKAILEFFIKTEEHFKLMKLTNKIAAKIHEHCTYIVDSLWEHSDLLKDWKTMTNLLLDQNSLIDLDDQEEASLIDFMCCAVKQAATGAAPPGRVHSRKQSNKEKKTVQDDRTTISTHFMECLPDLVEKYKADVPKVRGLLNIPQYFDLELYAEKRLTKHLETLLGHMEDIVLKHADKQLLGSCALTYHYLKENELVMKQIVEISLNRLLDGIVEKFRKSLSYGIPNVASDKESQAHVFNIVTGLKRILAFNTQHDLSDWDIYQEIYAINDQGASGNVEDEILTLSLNVMFQSLLQMLNSIDPHDPNKGDLKRQRKRLKAFLKHLDDLLQFSDVAVQVEVFKILCDLFMFFPKQLLNENPQFDSIVLQPDKGLQVRMRDFIISHVFNSISDEDLDDDSDEDDNRTRELNEKRTLLAGFCKLLIFEIFDFKLAAPIYAQLVRAFADYSDIIKLLMNKSKEINVITFSKVLLFALQQVFESLREDKNGDIDPKSKDFMAIKELARRFALQTGININSDNIRKSTITIHREGIKYALRNTTNLNASTDEQVVPNVPPNLLFMEILQEFAYRVTKPDRKVVLRDLINVAGDMLHRNGGEWSSLRTYKTEMEKGADTEINKIPDEAEKELEDELALEKQHKKTTGPVKKKAQKKLSLSKAADTDKWLSKKSIGVDDEEETPQPPTKVARGIPKARMSIDESAEQEGGEQDNNDAGESGSDIDEEETTSAGHKLKNATPTIASSKTGNRGSVAKQSVNLSARDKQNEDDEDSDINSTITDEAIERNDGSQKSWLDSEPSHGGARKSEQSYRETPTDNKRKKLNESSQDSGSDVSTSSSREMRASKRRKQEDS